MQQGLGTSSTLEQAPTVVNMKDEVAAVKSIIQDVPAALTKLSEDVDGLRLQFSSPSSLENAPLIQQMRSEIAALQSSSTSSTPPTNTNPDTLQLAAAVGEAVAKVLGSVPARDSHDWAGVAGSKVFLPAE